MGLTLAVTLPAIRSGRQIRFVSDRYSSRTTLYSRPAGIGGSGTSQVQPDRHLLPHSQNRGPWSVKFPATGSLTLETGAS